MAKKMSPKKARQGREGFPVLMVLVAALVLAAIAWGVAELFGNYFDQTQEVEVPQSSENPIEEPREVPE